MHDTWQVHTYKTFSCSAGFFGASIVISIWRRSKLKMHPNEVPKFQQALVVRDKGAHAKLEVQTVPVPQIKDDEVLIRISCSGIWYVWLLWS